MNVDQSFGADEIIKLEVEIEHLRKAIESRDVIGQAKGILMERFRVTADQAFHMLVQTSQKHNVKLVSICVTLAETGEWIGPPGG